MRRKAAAINTTAIGFTKRTQVRFSAQDISVAKSTTRKTITTSIMILFNTCTSSICIQLGRVSLLCGAIFSTKPNVIAPAKISSTTPNRNASVAPMTSATTAFASSLPLQKVCTAAASSAAPVQNITKPPINPPTEPNSKERATRSKEQIPFLKRSHS